MGSLNLSCPNSVLITLRSVHPGLKPGRSRLSLLTSKVFKGTIWVPINM